MAGRDRIKEELISRIDFVKEFNELLGPGKGTTRKCWNSAAHANGDKNASLSFSPKHGGWKCHSCGERGDIFTIVCKTKGIGFPQAYRFMLEKYNLWSQIVDPTTTYTQEHKRYVPIKVAPLKGRINDGVAYWMSTRAVNNGMTAFMYTRYGLTVETLTRWKVGFDTGSRRLWIPVWTDKSQPKNMKGVNDPRIMSLVNIRQHDAFRSQCSWINTDTHESSRGRPEGIGLQQIATQQYGDWKPVWTSSGKVVSVQGHGCTYVYPFEVLEENTDLYIVGGELKALLLNQLGRPAVAFTAGEGAYNEEFLPYFIGKNVKVLFDADPEKGVDKDGLSKIDHQAMKLGQYLANSGAYVQVGRWQQEIKDRLPVGGDITDFLRLADYNTQALDMLEWIELSRQTEDVIDANSVDKISAEETVKEPKWDDVSSVKFGDLVDPSKLKTWVKFKGLLSGTGDPYVVPQEVEVTCKTGEASMMQKCLGCSLPQCGFRRKIKYTAEAQVELVGMQTNKLEERILADAEVLRRCKSPTITVNSISADITVFTPTVDVQDEENGDDAFQYGHRQVYLMNSDKSRAEENVPYEVLGYMMADPMRGTFTVAATKWKPLRGDILSFKHDGDMSIKLKVATMHGSDIGTQVEYMTDELRDYIVGQIYGADDMLMSIFLSFFMPFRFRIGTHELERICPSVMILGDTNTGKSTASKRIIRYYGGGRYATADANPTFAGLVGGNLKLGNSGKMNFSWGLLPTSNRALVALDEYNKLPVETIGAMTNVMSSGIAERTTVNGTRRAQCHVRMLCLCNPRGDKRLTSYSNPLHAAQQVAGTVQDLGRFEYVHVQYPLEDTSIFSKWHEPKRENVYTKDIARYHMQWAWSRKREDIEFEDPRDIFVRALELAEAFGQARFKVARIAAGFAAMLYSTDNMCEKVIVKREHVDLALQFLRAKYDKYIDTLSAITGTLPSPLIRLFDSVGKSHYKRLRLLSSSQRWTYEDLVDVFSGNEKAQRFIELSQFELGLVSRKGQWYIPTTEITWGALMEDYLIQRQRGE
jgi:hypothetical protein